MEKQSYFQYVKGYRDKTGVQLNSWKLMNVVADIKVKEISQKAIQDKIPLPE